MTTPNTEIAARVEKTTTYRLTPEQVEAIILKHLGITQLKTTVEFDCGYESLREVLVRSTEIEVHRSDASSPEIGPSHER